MLSKLAIYPRAYVRSELYSNLVLYEAASNISRCWVYSQYIQATTHSTEQYSNWVLVLVLVLYEAASDSRSTCLVCGFQTERMQRGEGGWGSAQETTCSFALAHSHTIIIVCLKIRHREEAKRGGRVRPRNNLFFRTCLLPRHTKKSSFVWKSDTERRQRGEGEGPPKKQLVFLHLPVA